MTQLQQRTWSIAIDVPGLRREITGARVQFKVRKSLDKNPNPGTITITNLNAESRQAVTQPGVSVRLTAGHRGYAGVLFVGDIVRGGVSNTKVGADWETEFRLGDGHNATNFKLSARRFNKGAALGDVVKQLGRDFVDNIGNLDKLVDLAENRAQQLVGGYAAHGPAARSFEDVARRLGLTFSVQDGVLQMQTAGQPARSEVVLLSPATGLIGSVEFGAAENKKGPATLKAKSILNHALQAGGVVAIDAAGAKGQYLIDVVTHMGDSDGQTWYTEVEAFAKPL